MATMKSNSSSNESKTHLPSPPPSPPIPRAGVDVPLPSRDVDLERQDDYPPPTPAIGLSTGTMLGPTLAGGQEITQSRSRDPLLLRDRLLSEEALSVLRKRGRKGKTVGKFYEDQNEHITSMLKTIDEDAQEGREETSANATRVKIAVNASFIINCCLAVLQLYAAISSLSLSFFATALDSIFDPAANFVLNFLHRRAAKVDLHRWPAGGSRFETIGNISYSGGMLCASVVLVVETIQALIRGDTQDDKLHIPATVAVSVSFLAKLGLFLYCWAIRDADSQVRVLWEDHRNDLFINGFGIFSNAAGAKIAWWIDPSGAMIISLVLIYVWGTTIMREFRLLAGIGAPISFLQRVVYKAMMFSDDILQIDSIKCYHAGPSYIVELDIVLDANMPLHRSHDIAQLLQDKIEALKNVDRCHVHCDFETSHKPEHQKSR